jgi:hypothetical protein
LFELEEFLIIIYHGTPFPGIVIVGLGLMIIGPMNTIIYIGIVATVIVGMVISLRSRRRSDTRRKSTT